MMTLTAILALVSLCAFGYSSPLPTSKDYVFTQPVNTNRITGLIMGPGGDYMAMRVEDVAFINEAVTERNAIVDGSYGGFCVTNVTRSRLVTGNFPFDYTNRYPETIVGKNGVVAYVDTNAVTNVTAQLGIDTLWPQKLQLHYRHGWIDPDETWPDKAMDVTEPISEGGKSYNELPTWLAPPALNPQGSTNVSATAVVSFVVWPIYSSVTNAYSWLATTEKFCKWKDLSSGGPTKLVDTGQDSGTWLSHDLDYENEQVSIKTIQNEPRPTSTNVWSASETAYRFGSDYVSRIGVGGQYWSIAVDKEYNAVFTGKTPKGDGPFTLNFSRSGDATAEAQYRMEGKSDDNECIVDLGIMKNVATTGIERVKQVDLYLMGWLRGGTNLIHTFISVNGNYSFRGDNRAYGDNFGTGWGNGRAYDKDPDVTIVIPLLDVEVVDVPHSNQVWNSALERYEYGDVWYTVGARFTADIESWSSDAFKVAELPGWGSIVNSIVNDLTDPSSSPPTPDPIPDCGGEEWAWASQSSHSHAIYDLAFHVAVDRVVVTCDLKTKIDDQSD